MLRDSVNSRYYYNRPPQPVPEYYYDEADDYVADYSESEALSENQVQPPTHLHNTQMHRPGPTSSPAGVTELYRRKAVIPTLQYSHQHPSYIPEYYYENAATTHIAAPVRRIPLQNSVAQYTHSMPVVEQRMSHYCVRPIIQNEGYEFSSAPHIASNVKVYDTVPHMPTERRPKRHPVTLKATRYYKKPSTTLCKRPSALCLPVGSQPDPAVYRRPKRHTHTSQQYRLVTDKYPHNHNNSVRDPYYTPVTSNVENQVREQNSNTNFHKMDSEGDVNQRINHLENMLNKFEKEINGDQCLDGGDSKAADMAKIAKFLKPKIPPSLKAKQNKSVEENDVNKSNKPSSTNKEVDEITADSLEKLLTQLKKCENTTNRDFPSNERQFNYDKKAEEKSEPINNQYSYDLTENLQQEITESNQEIYEALGQHENQQDLRYNFDDDTHYRRSVSANPTCSNFRTQTVLDIYENGGDTCIPMHTMQRSAAALDDNCALELHRSKSYIVNLIDRALSKELGTVPAEKFSRNQFEHMNTKKAIHVVNRHTYSKTDQDVPRIDVIHQKKFPDAIISNASIYRQPKDVKVEAFVNNANEPLYIKQLKELRWGHLRHIQREVRRLEDLERFLDSCGGMNPQSTCNADTSMQ